MDIFSDNISPLAREILKLDAGRAYEKLVVKDLGHLPAKHLLDDVSSDHLFVEGKTPHRDPARCVLAGLWLWHDWLDESHEVCQNIHTPEGSFLHAIMHRREGDFSNSKYWYAKVGEHVLYPTLAVNSGQILNRFPADKTLLRVNFNGWNPDAFVDLVESVTDLPADNEKRRAVVALQQMEWRTLFDHCVRA